MGGQKAHHVVAMLIGKSNRSLPETVLGYS